MQYSVPQLPKELLANDFTNQALGNNEKILSHVAEKIEHVPYQGTLCYMQGATYPKKGFPFPEKVARVNIIKTTLLEITKHPIPVTVAFLLNRTKTLDSINYIFKKTCQMDVLKKHFLCPAAYATHKFMKHFLVNLGINEYTAEGTATLFSHLLEYDDAYRYRFQDIISEADAQSFVHSPHKEIKRLLSILKEREGEGNQTARKISALVSPLTFLLLVPNIRKAYKKAAPYLLQAKYDEADRYWASLKGDAYKFTGKTYEERMKNLTQPYLVEVLL